MLEKYSYAITIILLISSIVSPIITAIINNRHQLAIKKIDMYETAKRNALSEFIDCAQATILNSDDSRETMNKYISSFDKLFIYFSDISVETIIPFDHARGNLSRNYSDENYKKANHELSKFVSSLSNQIKKI